MRDWLCPYQDSEIAFSEVRGQAYVKREDAGHGEEECDENKAELWLRQEVEWKRKDQKQEVGRERKEQ